MAKLVEMDRATATSRLREVGLKVTELRILALTLIPAKTHLAADDVFERIKKLLPTTSRQATYGVLAALHTAGLVNRIEPAGMPALYELRAGDNHHHLSCKDCHRVVDIDCVIGAAPCLTPSNDHGFKIAEAEVVFWGLCADCQEP